MINRNVTRTILNATEATEKTKTPSDQELVCALATTDALYLGFTQPFTTRHIQLSTVNTNAATLTVSAWNGSAWVTVEGLIDQTAGFTKSGFISWLNLNTWQKHQLAPLAAVGAANTQRAELEHYWVRIQTSANMSGGTAIQSVLNLFCDVDAFRVHYPEIVSDTRYLPSSQTTFMAQYLAAKDMVVLRLKQMGKIKDEGDILDVNEVSTAAVHATAYIILHPIASDEESRAKADAANKALGQELSRATFSVDENADGQIDKTEKFSGMTWMSR